MVACAACGKPIPPDRSAPAIRSGEAVYHLRCAPGQLIEGASEEYQAILKKGVRYFVEKYSSLPEPSADVGNDFLELGRAFEAEREHRKGSTGHPSNDAKRA
jgi:hypothetical protein